MSTNPLTVTKLLTTLSVVFAGIFTFSFGQIETTRDVLDTHAIKLAEHEVRINHMDKQLDGLTKQLLMLDSKIEDKTDLILKAIKAKNGKNE